MKNSQNEKQLPKNPQPWKTWSKKLAILRPRGIIRWFGFSCGTTLGIVACLQGQIVQAIIAYAIGMMGGLVSDAIGINRLWRYPRYPFLTRGYLAIIVPSWGLLGLIVNMAWNLIGNPLIAAVLLPVAVAAAYEIPNLKLQKRATAQTQSPWTYKVPLRLIAVLYFPLILLLRASFLVLLATV